MPKTNHSQLPWEVDETPEAIQIVDGQGLYVATIDSIKNPEANASFIVQACNSHEKLMEALRKIGNRVGCPEVGYASLAMLLELNQKMRQDISDIVQQAIQYAEGKENES